MNRAKKIELTEYPPMRRHGDQARAISLTIEQAERENSARIRRMLMVLAGSALLLLVNALAVTLFG